MYTYEQKKEIYKHWLENGRPYIDKSKEPTYIERKVILEMKEQENARAKYHKELEERTKRIRDKESEQRVKDVKEKIRQQRLVV